ncbi:MAG: hypothetical protein U0975_16240 [Erythrobacter sp.]|nr:hypothetical protein [Erythrobacter sp.]MDZ4274211.1 hypothetical protein [Erythrobacter sp.]
MGWKKNVGIGAGVLFGLAVIGAAMGDPAEKQAGAQPDAAGAASPPENEPPAPPVNDPGISASEFKALQTGMTQAEATAIVGSEGEVISENEIAGTRTVMVQWEGESGFGANANAMFQNGKLIQKSQFGLE